MGKSETIPLVYTIQKYLFRWNKDLNIRQEITIVIDKNSQYALCNIFLDTSPQERETKAKIN